jgi:hypothetical protein
LAFRIPAICPRIGGAYFIHRALSRIPNWHPGRSKKPLNENLFYEAELKHQKFTGIKGLIRKI